MEDHTSDSLREILILGLGYNINEDVETVEGDLEDDRTSSLALEERRKEWKIGSHLNKIKQGKKQILGLHEEQHIFSFVHGLETRSLVKFFSTILPMTYKGLMEKTYTWIEVKEVATNGNPNDHKEGFDRFNKGFSWDNNNTGKNKNRDKFSPYKGSKHGLLTNLSKSPRESQNLQTTSSHGREHMITRHV
ncbi:hypothetical protein Tco_0487274 [Tanacetum coccineum]